MIAHSLQSLVDFDRVFVLDLGRLVEVGAPQDLLDDEGSAFRALCYASRGETKIRETRIRRRGLVGGRRPIRSISLAFDWEIEEHDR
jgi:ABC-type multidrug transport system ATPase subunit